MRVQYNLLNYVITTESENSECTIRVSNLTKDVKE